MNTHALFVDKDTFRVETFVRHRRLQKCRTSLLHKMSDMAAHDIVHTDGSTCKRKPAWGRWKNKTITSLRSSEPEHSPVFSKAVIN